MGGRLYLVCGVRGGGISPFCAQDSHLARTTGHCCKLRAPDAIYPWPVSTSLLRVEVRVRPGVTDPRAAATLAKARSLGFSPSSARVARVYLIEGKLKPAQKKAIAQKLLADPVTEVAFAGVEPAADGTVVEVHPLPGVMDPAGQSVREAIYSLLGVETAVATGVRYDLHGVTPEDAAALAQKTLANPVIHRIVTEPYVPKVLPKGGDYEFQLTQVPLRGKTDEELEALSRGAHLFMSLPELRAVRDYFEAQGRDPTDIELETIAQTWSEHCVHKTLKSKVVYGPVSVSGPKAAAPKVRADGTGEFEMRGFAGAKKSGATGGAPALPAGVADPITWAGRPGHTLTADGSVKIDNLLRSTVAAATFELIKEGVDWTLSVFKDNSGVVELDAQHGVCIKVETHNHPSAIEPYGGAATGAGGCIRDVIGTGLGAKPIASTDVFCVGRPTSWGEGKGEKPLPPGTIHPRRVLSEVVAGVRDYGNRMGIPTVNGAVAFDDRYVGNPLVFCGCVGLIPRHLVHGKAQAGDRIIALGGRTGRDGIHGATFSSAELEHTHADEFAHAVQIGNAIEEKRVLDAILRARGDGTDPNAAPLFHAMTDCGAGGFSSAIGEMGNELGAQVLLDQAPLKYAGLSHTEIWISEAQERMVLAVPPENLEALGAICQGEGVEMADLGVFGTENRELELYFQGEEVGRLAMEFLHEGVPMPTRHATWLPTPAVTPPANNNPPAIADALKALLAHPTIASKHWIVRQYDHEVQGNVVIKPLVGVAGQGPGDATVLEPIAGSGRGIALASGLQTPVGDASHGGDPYHMALAAIDECVRNLVCVGANPNRTAILDNFCWPSCSEPHNMAALVRACEGCYDGAKAYRTPFVSGKDSLNNQLRYDDPETGQRRVIEIPHTLLITGLAQVASINRCVTMDAKTPGNLLVLVGANSSRMGASYYSQVFPGTPGTRDEFAAVPAVDLTLGPKAARGVAQMISDGLVRSAHDCSEGGLLVAVAEMLLATAGAEARGSTAGEGGLLADLLSRTPSKVNALGAELSLASDLLEPEHLAFAEDPSRYVLEVRAEDLNAVRTIARDHGGLTVTPIGKLNQSARLTWGVGEVDVAVDELLRAWRAPLDW